MKRKALVMILALLLCLLLCACGSYKEDRVLPTREPGAGVTDRNGVTDQTDDGMPDAKDGYVDDGNAADGVVDENPGTPSPSITHKP